MIFFSGKVEVRKNREIKRGRNVFRWAFLKKRKKKKGKEKKNKKKKKSSRPIKPVIFY